MSAGLLILFAFLTNSGAVPERAHLVVFLADDLGWADCSLHGGPATLTPHMTRIAGDGLCFTHAFVASPSCAPSRAALLTGLDPFRNGAMLNHTRPRPGIKLWPAYFRELGYETVAIGKTAHYAQVKQDGFDHASHFNYHQDDCIDAAVAWLTKRTSTKPLCLLVGTNWPHVPWPQADPVAPAWVTLPATLVDTPETRQARARYAAAVARADRDLGRVYDAARAQLGRNCLFVFTADHGAQFPFSKWNCYDAGVRTPLVAVWPERIRPGTTTDALVSWIDLLPTCIEAAGGVAPSELSGQSLLPLFRQERTTHRERVFLTHSADGMVNRYPIRAVRTRDWKYIRNLDPAAEFHSHVDLGKVGSDGRDYWDSWIRQARNDPAATAIVRRYHTRPAEELYDLRSDPSELHNLAAQPAHAGRLQQLRGDLDTCDERTTGRGAGDRADVTRGPIGSESEGRSMNCRGCLLLISSLAGWPVAAAESPAVPPNIIIVLVDDFGRGDLGSYGGTIAQTPQLDRMAREGVRFTQFYVAAPICSPSRAGIITGQFPARWRITSYLQTRAGNAACEQADFLDPEAPSLPRVLQSAGYATAHIGKWHLGGGRDVVQPPKFRAYGYTLGLGTWESPEPHPDLTGSDWVWSDQDKIKRWHRTEWMVDQTVAFLRDHADRPCFVNLWLDDTHTPWVPSAEDQQKKMPNARPMLWKVLEELDRQMGRLLADLRARRSDRPTLVVLCGDNGPLPTFQQARTVGQRGSKLSLYEGGIRVPGIAWGPVLVREGVTNTETVLATVDLLPSLCRLAGATLPAGHESDGEDLSTALLGTATPRRTKPLLWEYGRNETSFAYPKEPGQRSPNVAIREGNWKLLVNADGTTAELYDLANDPQEQTNLAAEQKALTRRLTETALDWRKSMP